MVAALSAQESGAIAAGCPAGSRLVEEPGREMFSVWCLRLEFGAACLLADGPERRRKKVLTCQKSEGVDRQGEAKRRW